MLISFKFNCLSDQIEKNIAWINKIDYMLHRLIIYVIATDINYSIYIYYFIICKNI